MWGMRSPKTWIIQGNSGKLSSELLQLKLHPPIFHSLRRKIRVFVILRKWPTKRRSIIPIVDTNKQNYRPTDFVESPINYSAVFFIPPISVKQVVEDLKNVPDNKATGLDRIGIKPLKKALNAAAPSLTHIYNDSIASSSFPDNLKRAKLTHVHKNNSIHDRNNYRPISILSVISKPLERHVSRSYLKGLTSNTLLHSKQAENRPYHSCETALRSLTNNWLKAMDSKQAVSAVLLDFSKAFDLVDRSLLLSKISMYHTDNTSLRWSESSNTAILYQWIMVWRTTNYFLLYINAPSLAIPDCNVDIYTDDTTLWMANSNPLYIQHGLQGNLNKANLWFSLNKMVPNAKRTKQLLVGTKQKLSYCTNPSRNLSLRVTEIEEAVNEKLLGVKIGKHFNWNSHIDYMITKLNSRVNLLKRARKYLNLSLKTLLCNALIKPIFEYCWSVWGNTKIDNLQRLLRTQKRCVRVILNAGTERTVGLCKRLGWIPISNIIEQRKLCIMHNTHNMDLSIPFFSTMTGKRSFLASGTRLWKNQDSTTRGLTSLCKFKNQLYKKYIDRNSRVDNLTISRNFKLIFNF